MSVYVFVGPTLPAEQARRVLDATYLPPASEGDVQRIAKRRPKAIGIIDGYFECVPAVWHKEILWAMAQGVRVYGSASMGALRAAELAAFGMEGAGKIFEAYRDGILEDDDEVAIIHSSGRHGYQPKSVAMVNIRATLKAAEAAGVIRRVTRRKLERTAKELFYQERTYATIFERADRQLSSCELEALRGWLPTGQIDQKREDALAMLRAIGTWVDADIPAQPVEYSFEYTANWEIARCRAGSLCTDSQGQEDTILLERLLDEMRLEGGIYAQTQEAVLLRFLALEEAWRLGMVPTPGMIRSATERFRREKVIEDEEAFQRWLAENDLCAEDFLELMKDQARLEWVRNLARMEAEALVPDHLRVTGHYARLANRVLGKQRALKSEGL